MVRYQIRDGYGTRSGVLPGWALAIGLAAAAVIGTVFVAIGIGLALILAPVALVGVFVLRWRLRKLIQELAARRPSGRQPFSPRRDDGEVIEGDYRVVDEGRGPRS